ncbi:MAG: ABC transporter permease [Lactobacillus sp.]|jgi:ABC-2 type transport system permease protein|uniref:Transport permease protein n=1 Tax=Lacticaseibacillus suilingensis TaxID=2799577 RepID=A0ABW4BEY6_9LACO|nr:ABC transporter permease [Lacticaseibacillus suilingensis]MCI1893537.1 ABC transporter permease [Lactobacillus sp.]MCI1916793.1 ABC transporter permease [Lactobacillus sp.]MCI1940956.1 ABC transporter permease [Lactobacillus sp.]MCI1971571.1 ABC transporter permease [Lactobacillus sp.]MCI2016068.1 ABC transporter permease [Lactobacillus sp.]
MQTFNQLRTLTGRIIRQNLTNADTIITVIAMPVFMLLFFVYVMGGNIATTGAGGAQAYLRYALPGFLLLTMAMGSAYTSMRINLDRTSGFLDRLHSLPIARWVILGSHVLASVTFMLMAEALVFLVGVLIGYRADVTLSSALLFVGLSVLFGLGITLLAIPFSLKADNYASAGGFSYVLLMLLFVSSALMPTTGMAKPVQMFADHQPMTPIVNTARGLLNQAVAVSQHTEWLAVGWLVGAIVVCGFLSYRVYVRMFLTR